jgi:LacI family transcriptional regulator
MSTRPRIALLIESSRAYGQGLLRGITAYIRDHRPWSIYQQERMMSDDAPAWLDGWRGDGVIARIESPALLRAIQRLHCPAVDLRGMHDIPGIPLIETDDQAVTRLAVAHLAERGFRHFAYCGYQGANFSARRLKYFLPLVRHAGFEPLVYEGTATSSPTGATVQIEGRALMYERPVADWVERLPKPVAIMACNDVRGQQMLSACRDRGVAVPDDVAVIGVDNDQIICELCDPPLSSVEPNTRQIGYDAAGLLDRMMAGQRASRAKTFIGPLGVVARASTDVLAIPDRLVAAALRYIRQHACDGIGVEEVLENVPLSRSTLERRFARYIGRAPKAEITRVQIERVKQLLRSTPFPLVQIADLTGYAHHESMCTIFKRETGKTPGEYRRETGKPTPESA